VPRDLHTEVARKPVGALDQNDAHAVAGDLVEHGAKAQPLGHRVGAAHRRVVELVNDAITTHLGKQRDRRALPLVAVLVGSNVRG
jgi:hypothetical protein